MSTNPDSELDVQALLQDEKKKISLMTSSIEDKEVGLQTLITISEILGELYAPYVEQTLTVAYPLISYSINENIRSSAASLLAVLVGIMGSS